MPVEGYRDFHVERIDNEKELAQLKCMDTMATSLSLEKQDW